MFEESSINSVKYAVIFGLLGFIILALFLLPLEPIKAQNQQTRGSFAASLTGNTMCSAGLGCEQSTQTPNLLPFSGLFGGSNQNLAGDPVITVVNVEDQTAIYRIINGMKHAIPTTEIFYSYDLNLDMVQKITPQELVKYPIARLFLVAGTEEDENPTIYYLTEGGMLRPIMNDVVFYSYGNRREDIITINLKEFNYYPRNQYIFVERPKLNREIYQITGGIKRYLTPVAVRRMNLQENEIAPVNQTEFDAYPDGEPVIF